MTMGISSHHLRVIYITFGAVSMGPHPPRILIGDRRNREGDGKLSRHPVLYKGP